jgi:D-proline reductase (dithiol) PrdB
LEDPLPVDSFKYLPRIIAAYYRMTDRAPGFPIPWTPIPRSLAGCRFGLVTSGGLYHAGIEPPFDVEREKEEPTWGDPSYRILPADIRRAEVGVSHLHFNPRDVLDDPNILLPIDRFQELAVAGRIAGLANSAYSFMGYQGFPADTTAWRETYSPQVVEKLKAEDVDCVLLTPA